MITHVQSPVRFRWLFSIPAAADHPCVTRVFPKIPTRSSLFRHARRLFWTFPKWQPPCFVLFFLSTWNIRLPPSSTFPYPPQSFDPLSLLLCFEWGPGWRGTFDNVGWGTNAIKNDGWGLSWLLILDVRPCIYYERFRCLFSVVSVSAQ